MLLGRPGESGPLCFVPNLGRKLQVCLREGRFSRVHCDGHMFLLLWPVAIVNSADRFSGVEPALHFCDNSPLTVLRIARLDLLIVC